MPGAPRTDKPLTVVLCPMSIEHRAVLRAVRAAGLSGVDVVQTGIGRDAVERAVDAAAGRRGRMVLAGACGGLVEGEEVPRIGRIVDEHGHEWRTGEPGVTLVGVDRIVSTPEQKRSLAEHTGAAIVDMESHAFAGACERLGLAWAVVRGVSDTPGQTLPAELLRWINPVGGTRAGRAVWDMLRRPRLVGHIAPVLRRSKRVLAAVGERVAEMAAAGES